MGCELVGNITGLVKRAAWNLGPLKAQKVALVLLVDETDIVVV